MIKYSFLKRWFTDNDDCVAMEKHIDCFLGQFPASLQPIICKLLDKYDFYDEFPQEELFDNYKTRLKKFINYHNIDDYVITMPFDKESHNSYSFSTIFKGFDYSGVGTFLLRISDAEFSKFKNIIFIDDYSGTGKSFIEFYNSKKELISKNTNVFFLPCLITRLAEQNIGSSSIRDLVTLSNDVSNVRHAKFLEEQCILTDIEIEQLVDYSVDSLRITKSLVRGYENTEDLLSLSYMTPNNTIALFWWVKNSLYFPLFRRNAFGQRNSIKHPRFKYDFIKTYNESIKANTSIMMRKYLVIAILLLLGNDLSSVKKQCNFKKFDFDEGIKYLKNQQVLDETLSPSLSKIKIFIDIDKVIIFEKTGTVYNNNSTIKNNLIKAIQ